MSRRPGGEAYGRKQAVVIKWLRENRGFCPLSRLKEVTSVDLAEFDAGLLEELKKDERVVYNSQQQVIRYQSKHLMEDGSNICRDVCNIRGLSNLLRQEPCGLPYEELVDAYPGADQDLDLLFASGQAVRLPNSQDRSKRIVYWRERQGSLKVEVDEDLRGLWHDVRMPKTPSDLNTELKKMGHMTEQEAKTDHVNSVRNFSEIEKKKRKKPSGRRWRRNITNKHMEGKEGFDFLKK